MKVKRRSLVNMNRCSRYVASTFIARAPCMFFHHPKLLTAMPHTAILSGGYRRPPAHVALYVVSGLSAHNVGAVWVLPVSFSLEILVKEAKEAM